MHLIHTHPHLLTDEDQYIDDKPLDEPRHFESDSFQDNKDDLFARVFLAKDTLPFQ